MKRMLTAAGLLAALAGLATAPAAPLSPQGDDFATSLKGKIVWKGAAPERKKIDVKVDKTACLAKGPLFEEEVLVNAKNGGLANVFIWIEPAQAGGAIAVHPNLKAIKVKKVEIDQPCCMFEPRVIAIREGQDVVAKNGAPVAHNIRWTGNPEVNAGGNVTLPAGKEYVISGLKAQRLPLVMECNIHPWMRGRIGVFEHPYFAVTDADGNFEIKLPPKGDYKLMIYHELGYRGGKAGRDGMPVTIKGGQVLDLGTLEFNVKK